MLVRRFLAHEIKLQSSQPLESLNLTQLQELHEKGLEAYRSGKIAEQGVSWLDVKKTLAYKLLEACNFCSHLCQVNRLTGQTGYCQLKAAAQISGEYIHHGEEPAVGITHAIFFSGCTMHCLFCHNWRETFDLEKGLKTETQFLADQIIKRSQNAKIQSISFIGGTPEPHLHILTELACLLSTKVKLPWVFNNNATLSKEGLELMEGLIDIYLPDFKFGNADCAWKLAKISNYLPTVKANLKAYQAQKSEILVRHLLMPGHLECCTLPILDNLAQEFDSISLNLMGQYRPFYRALEIPALNQRPDPKDLKNAREKALALGIQLIENAR
ncbi:hypothetical protein COW36_15105 [bacterium (Candidatus Blackallbacteria) CG17_big_fil_post_rev_8_21_14_2_50_48_46]|uniref:Radical SAM core domain-containing protein n=1 Tax=bacterium (Candidatus Blackallbacteria) CG17_big_fil_post_rev_8_21_14_2_50_48_46 TaxID=2014261 RepID=A0A2M7G2L1_9BACT|nr:MAG: hypothetical protein COW64_11445 [bacterium (Candidatus Blackallbacteria) CG18_big_fil_WC_8_21_14_2_50_49_26]PIW16038.1 MAG: hypothetical protein COW36_15105 [bacterium (Candidatus Blackallbacteria) CG17_big_fil_post_rev_8_21_14_2_50_48_46]PIW50450.1 MAG: hypothetical protein COW20_02820 [bacterium (Candidatus Blackallbacteria) CG13_big_fil_rev_8_21_14_2_50_49_14]